VKAFYSTALRPIRKQEDVSIIAICGHWHFPALVVIGNSINPYGNHGNNQSNFRMGKFPFAHACIIAGTS
jgi:hypothetical protein